MLLFQQFFGSNAIGKILIRKLHQLEYHLEPETKWYINVMKPVQEQ